MSSNERRKGAILHAEEAAEMIPENIFPEGATAFKTNLHCHSTWSDGVMSPEEIKSLYKRNGYSVVAFTDHHVFRHHRGLADEAFLPLAGYELNFDEFDSKRRLRKTCHLNAIAKDPDKAAPIEGKGSYSVETVRNAIGRLRDNGFIVNLNHPSWSNLSPEEVLRFEGLTAMEVFNGCCYRTYNSGESQLHFDSYLKAGRRCMALCADDNHSSSNAFSPLYAGRYREPHASRSVTEVPAMDCCRGYVMIYARELSYESVIESFIAGTYYSSNGPSISRFFIEDGTIRVDCSPVSAVFLKTAAWGLSDAVLDPEGGLTHAEFSLPRLKEKEEEYFRLELVDRQGRTAYTNPYYF